jgi:three-Cys-motif partner protein
VTVLFGPGGGHDGRAGRIPGRPFFKHEVLRNYLRAWSQKLGSVSQTGRRVRLWYVDCFAGPWSSRTEDHADTSVAIGMNALEEALSTWSDAPTKVEAGAIFVEANPTSATRLTEFLSGRPHKGVAWKVLVGAFGSQVAAIQGMIGDDAAFLFVDPTGWKGAGMQFVAPLAAGRWRDVLVNVMFHHINRWKDDPREFLRNQMRDLFGLGDADLPSGLGEEQLMALYRSQLKDRAKLGFVADLAVPHPTIDRTFFRLVVGGHHAEVVRLFRQVEEKVVGRDAGSVRDKAKSRVRESRTGQTELLLGAPGIDVRYRNMRDRDLAAALPTLRARIAAEGPLPFGQIWPAILEENHVTRKHLADAIMDEATAGRLVVQGFLARERTIKDTHLIAVPAG